jgi:hypothetical protein
LRPSSGSAAGAVFFFSFFFDAAFFGWRDDVCEKRDEG